MDQTYFRELLRLTDAGIPCASCTIVKAKGSIPNEAGAKMLAGAGGVLIAGTVGGGRIEHRVLAEAGAAINEGKSRLVEARLTEEEAGGIGMMCGGQVEVFIDVHVPAARLILCGAGHVNLALARMARGLGFAITVIDDRPEWANPDNYPDAEVLLAAPEDAIPGLGLDARSFVVVGTRAGDAEAIVAAAATPARYIGVVASKRKGIQLVKEIAGRVDDPRSLVERLRAPVGLDLGGRTPEALALSILAEIHAEHHGASGRPLTVDRERLACSIPQTARS